MNRHTLLLVLLVAPCAMGDAIDDPWPLVPALPNSCYEESDNFIARLDATVEELGAAAARQNEINEAISAEFRNMDLAEQQQRMMDFMMEHPEQAQDYMLAVSQLGQSSVDEVTAMSDERVQLHTESDELVARYDTAIEPALAPSQARYQDWVDRFWEKKAPESEGRQRDAEINAAYEAFCATWWNEGPFHDHFGRLRQSMADDVTQSDNALPETLKTYELLGISTQGYRSTEAIRAAQEYLRQVRLIFTKRWGGPMQYSYPI